MLELRNVTFAYTSKIVLKDVNLKVDDGEFIGLIGLNGAGKSTLLKLMLGINKPQSGEIENTFKRRSFVEQVTPTSDKLFPATVEEIVSLGLGYKPLHFTTREDKKKISETLEAMGVKGCEKKSMGELSGGQQQRVRLAKAIVSNPELLILDEPTTGMDEDGRKAFLSMIEDMHKKNHMTIIIVSHALEELKSVDHIYRLHDAKIIREGGDCPIHETED